FNIAKGMVGYYATLPATNDTLIAIALEASGLESDATLMDKDTFADVVSGATNEQTSLTRKTLASVTSTVNDVDDRRDIDAADITWTAPSGNPVGAIVVCYDSDTTGGTDANLIPLTLHTVTWNPADGIDTTWTVADLLRIS
ncbi:hypothetical protein, partial [Streptomyces fructofermentans]|uniref:hypothetical protein n=1 Tax=Streptomyces fructofermentans TaxID=152141 RepID=UPI0027E5547D